jgi:hypothetical protein
MLDVLEYNKLAADYNALAPALNVAITYANTVSYPAAVTAGYECGLGISFIGSLKQQEKADNFAYLATCALWTRPWCNDTWTSIPTLPNPVGNLRVFDTVEGRCGICCAWTVPAGATFARFRLWGAGAGSHGNVCCGISMFGGSGAYASVIMPVVPGCVYTLCSGCALCCCQYCDQGTYNTGNGCASYVTGYGLSNFCAEGGEANPACWLQRVAPGASSGVSGYCVIWNSTNGYSKLQRGTYYGYCMCNWGGFCFNPGGCSGGHDQLPYSTSCKLPYGSLTPGIATKGCHYVVGAPGMFNNSVAASTFDVYRYFTSPPIVDMTTTTCSSCYLFTTMGACVTYAGGAYQFPSRGGIGGNVCAGNFTYGLPGAGGAVCVTWI